MKRSVKLINWVLRRIFQITCRIDSAQLEKVPAQGPLILVGNHVNFLEAPVLIPHLDPRLVTGIAKRESWDNPLLAFLFDHWGIIPIDRGAVDREAFHRAERVLSQGLILAISPEGTRSKTGALAQGKQGVVVLAERSGAPLIPVAFYGHEHFWANLKHLRRTDIHIVVGSQFRLETEGGGISRNERQIVADEIMRKIAELLPVEYHGYYQNPGRAGYQYLVEI